jgi:Phage protein Gp138 N-terminal domain
MIDESLFTDGLIQSFLRNFRTLVPAKVINVHEHTNNFVDVELAITENDANGKTLEYVKIYQVPVMQLGGASSLITCELQVGDYGLLCVCDRDISNFKKNQSQSLTGSDGVANLVYGVFIPGLFLPHQEGIAIKSEKQITINCGEAQAVLKSSSIDLTVGNTKLTLSDSGVIITGNLTVTGNLISQGTIDAEGEIKTQGTSLSSHVHGGVKSGESKTTPPV